MNSTKAIMIACVFMVAAFAGVLIAADEGNDVDADSYTVTYKVGTMTYSVPSATAAITLPALDDLGATVDVGSTFIGWTIEGDSAQTVYAVGSTYSVSDPVTFVAKITVDKYTVAFAYADGTTILNKTELVYNADLTLPVKSTTVAAGKVLAFREIDGMIFAGWASALEPTVVIIEPSATKTVVTGDAAYVAVYVHDPVVSFIVDGATIIPATPEYKLVLPSNPSKEGFKFVGWNDGELTIPGEDLPTYISLLLGDVTLTAVWEPAVYTVTFIVDGETVMEQSVKHGDAATEPKFTPAKDGFDFVCWTASADSSAYDFGSAVTGDLSITAVFKATPAPAPTGLKDPTMQMMLVIIGTLVVALIALGVWKRDAIRSGLVKKLDKGKKGNGGDSA